jgi:hypothetical protein
VVMHYVGFGEFCNNRGGEVVDTFDDEFDNEMTIDTNRSISRGRS